MHISILKRIYMLYINMMQTCGCSFFEGLCIMFFFPVLVIIKTENSSSITGPDGESSLATPSKTQGEV